MAALRAVECPAETLELAKRLLGTFLDMQKQHETHLKLLLAQEAARRPATASSRAGILDYQIEPHPYQRRNPAWPSGVAAAK